MFMTCLQIIRSPELNPARKAYLLPRGGKADQWQSDVKSNTVNYKSQIVQLLPRALKIQDLLQWVPSLLSFS